MQATLPKLVLPAAAVLALGAALATGAQDAEGPAITSAHVAGKVHVLQGDGGNIGVSVGDDGVLMIDDKFARLSGDIDAALSALSEDAPRFLINTHWHGDHTGANEHFGRGAAIFAHANVRRRLNAEAGVVGRVSEPRMPAAGLPVVTFDDGLSLHFNGEEVKVFHVPSAHTDGDSIVWFTGSNVVHMGDLYFEAFWPFVDLSSGGSVRGVVDGCRAVIARVPADARILPGHGQPTGVEELASYADALADCIRQVEAARAEGQDAAAMHAAGLLAEYGPRWDGGTFMSRERFLSILAQDLEAGAARGGR